jgi:hypothetical protein
MWYDGVWTNASNSASVGPTDLGRTMELARGLMPKASDPIHCFRGTVADLQAAVNAENVRAGLPVVLGACDTFHGLDIVEEDGWVYLGTSLQLCKARDRYGSLGTARRAWADVANVAAKIAARCPGVSASPLA